ncbi:MAG: hypothetical protein AAFN79_10375 [Pseudomonadota bacterium]
MSEHGIGHNEGPPLDAGRAYRRYVWKRAKQAQLPKVGLETVRRHVRRAAQLGMTYPQYAAIRLGTGRDVRALLFSSAALGWRRGALPTPAVKKLSALEDVEALLLAKLKDHRPGAPVRSGPIRFAAAGPPPTSVAEAKGAVRVVLDPLQLPGDAVVLVSDDPAHMAWVSAGRLARLIPAESWLSA